LSKNNEYDDYNRIVSKEPHPTLSKENLFLKIIKPVVISIPILIVSFVVVYKSLTFYGVDIGFWNLSILFVEVEIGIIIALIVEKRTEENKNTVNKALGYIYNMIQEDYVLRRGRKNLISRNLKKNLIMLRFFTQRNLELIKLWRLEQDSTKKQLRRKALMFGFEDLFHSIKLLKEIKDISFDVFEYHAIELMDYIMMTMESSPVFDLKNNKCYFLTDNREFFDLINDLLSYTTHLLESDPDSFESNYKLEKQLVVDPEGNICTILAVMEKIPGNRKAHDPSLVMSELMAPTIFGKLNEKYSQLKSLEDLS